jgi:hypothetical protein
MMMAIMIVGVIVVTIEVLLRLLLSRLLLSTGASSRNGLQQVGLAVTTHSKGMTM